MVVNCGLRCGRLTYLGGLSSFPHLATTGGGSRHCLLRSISLQREGWLGDDTLHTLNSRGTSASHVLRTISRAGISGDTKHHKGPWAGKSPVGLAIPEFDLTYVEGGREAKGRWTGTMWVMTGGGHTRAFQAVSSPGSGTWVKWNTSCLLLVLICTN